MDINGLTKKEQGGAVASIHAAGMTVTGWARSREYSPDTVKNVLYRRWGRGQVGPTAAEIVTQLKAEGLA